MALQPAEIGLGEYRTHMLVRSSSLSSLDDLKAMVVSQLKPSFTTREMLRWALLFTPLSVCFFDSAASDADSPHRLDRYTHLASSQRASTIGMPPRCQVGAVLGNSKPQHCQGMPPRCQVGELLGNFRPHMLEDASKIPGWGTFRKLKAIILPGYAFKVPGRRTFGKPEDMILPEHASKMPA